VESLLEQLSPEKPMSLSAAAMERLSTYEFPGNIRELRNVLERGVILADGEVIQAGHLLLVGAGHDTLSAPKEAEEDIVPLDEMERRYLSRSLVRLGGDKDALARRLGISRRTINRKLQTNTD
jgi:DNA-binding NtrC family response regulator